MITDRVHYAEAISAYRRLHQGAFHIERLSDADIERMLEIMEQYADARFDFVDVSIMAIAERLGITEIYTFDRRDFSAFRPTHCRYFELLP
jgi:hypothetical protein